MIYGESEGTRSQTVCIINIIHESYRQSNNTVILFIVVTF